MSTSKIIGEVNDLYTMHGGCCDPMKTILAIDYAVERSVIDINELNEESEKGCLFVARDGTIYDGVSSGEESEAQYKIVPTGLITKFNNVPLLASFCKDKDREWHGAYVGTLDKLFETYKEFYKGQHDFSEQYIDLCFGDKPLLNLYGFGLAEILKNQNNYVFVPTEESETVYVSGDDSTATFNTVTLNVSDKIASLTKSLEKAQTQLSTSKLSKAKRKKLETRINQLKSDIAKEEALKEKDKQGDDITEPVNIEDTATIKPVEQDNPVKVDEPIKSIESAEPNEPAQEVVKPRRGRRPAAKNDDKPVAKRRARTKAEIEEELEITKASLEDYKNRFDEYTQTTQSKISELEKENAELAGGSKNLDTYIQSMSDMTDKLKMENAELLKEKDKLTDDNKRLLDRNIELSKQIENSRKSGVVKVVTDDEDKSTVDMSMGIDTQKLSDEASEILDDVADAAGIKSVCDIIYKKLIDKERWITKSGDNALRFYIKPLMRFVYNIISNSKPGDDSRNKGNGYVFSSNRKKLLINTNLVDCYGNAIYIIDHTPNEKSYTRKTLTVMQSKSSLVADGFTVESIRQLPGHVKFFDKSEYIFDACIEDFDLEDDEHLDHIINDRRNRFPESYRNVPAKIIADKLKNSVEQAIQISEIDYRYVMPMYNPKLNELEFLIPFYLDNHYGQKPELAIIVSKKQSFWKVFTIIKNEYAYFNARLLCNPNGSVF